MTEFRYSLMLFALHVKDGLGKLTRKPSWLWTQVTGDPPTLTLTNAVVFDDRDQMFSSLCDTELLSPDELHAAYKDFMERGFHGMRIPPRR